ncbi:MAG: HEPN domain-containing protein [bacterium]|nr:HEPN domain-containing protein [bacterium]
MEQHEEGTKIDLMKYRLETAKSDLKAAKILIEAEEYRASNNRAYYAIFHAISAIHAFDGKSYKRHKDTISNFNKDYVKTEIFPKEIGRKIMRAEEIRHESDYDDFYIATREKSQEQIETAEELLELVENFCKNSIREM